MRFLHLLLCFVFVLLQHTAVAQQGKDELSSPSSLTITIGQPQLHVDFRIKGTQSSGSQLAVDAENDLGLPHHDTAPWFRAEYRIDDRWHLYAEYLDTQRRGSVLKQTTVLVFGVLPLVIGTRYQTNLQLTNYRLGAAYKLIATEALDAGISAGLDVLDASLALRTTTLPFVTEPTQRGLVVLPGVGFFCHYQLGERGSFVFRAEGLPLHLKHYRADAVHMFAAYEYVTSLGSRLGVAYLRHDFRLSTDKSSLERDGHYSYQGPLLYLSSVF